MSSSTKMGRAPARGRGKAILAGGSLIFSLFGVAGSAEAAHGGNVHCGDIITASTTLSANVVEDVTGLPCSGHGVIIGAGASITLDLNGFKIIGDADAGGADAGVYISGKTGVTVTDSTAVYNSTTGKWDSNNQITGFENGVQLVDAANSNTVEKLNITGNIGLDLNGEGILIHQSDLNTLKGNTLIGNGPYAGITVLQDSDSNIIGVSGVGGGNVIAASNVTQQDIGIRLEQETAPIGPGESCTMAPLALAANTTDNNVVAYNTVTGSTIDAISILGGRCDAKGNELANNVLSGNGRDGIRLNNLVKMTSVHNNVVRGNGGAGIRLTLAALGNTITGNTSLGNNPIVVPPVVVSPLAPPHGDLHDGNVNCTGTGGTNSWSGNMHLTEFAPLGSTLAPIPVSTTGVPDYVCIS